MTLFSNRPDFIPVISDQMVTIINMVMGRVKIDLKADGKNFFGAKDNLLIFRTISRTAEDPFEG